MSRDCYNDCGRSRHGAWGGMCAPCGYEEYCDNVEYYTKGFRMSPGVSPGCEECSEFDEGSFSHFRGLCDGCGRTLGGTEYAAHGWNPDNKQIYHFSVCVDCYYYFEYGRLDDMTMSEIEGA